MEDTKTQEQAVEQSTEQQEQAEAQSYDDVFDSIAQSSSEPPHEEQESEQPEQPKVEQKLENNVSKGGTEEDEIRKKAHGYDSMLGRLNKSQQREKELEAQIEALKAQYAQSVQSKEQVQTPSEQKSVQLDDDMQEQMEFIPSELRSMFSEDSKDGKKLRTALEDYGADYASTMAQSIADHRAFEQMRTDNVRTAQENANKAHIDRVVSVFPEYEAALRGNAAEHALLVDSVDEFISTLPYKEGKRFSEIAEHGNAEEVIELLTALRNHKKGNPAQVGEARARAASDGYAVPTRGTSSGYDTPSNDYDAAFDEAAAAYMRR